MKINLKDHIQKLQKREAETPVHKTSTARDNILFWGTAEDKNYLAYLKPCVGTASVHLKFDSISVLSQVQLHCETKKLTKVITTSVSFLKLLLHWDKKAAPSLSAYSGSFFTISGIKNSEYRIEIIIIPPLKNLMAVSYGKFTTTRYIEKFTQEKRWYIPTEFNWELLTPGNEEGNFTSFAQDNCFLVAIDIETFKENAAIRCISYTGFWYDLNESNGIHSKSVVLPMDSEYALAIMRKWNWNIKAPKVFQNGKYDIAYLARYNALIYNWLYDTAHMFHSWYSELPKDLGYLNSFFIRKAVYWKDLSDTTDLYEYYKYNALDTWGTGNCLLAMLLELPDWAIQNYLLEFPLVFPCHMAEMRGIERDMKVLEAARNKQDEIVKTLSISLNKILGVSDFNVKSPKQMKQLLTILGCGDLKSADEKNLKRARFRHPFNARIIKLILDIREARTLKEKYLQIGEKAKEFHRLDGTGNRILYALNPQGTDSTRLASREHHFWTGLQIQNIPRGVSVKCTLIADPGFNLGEVDLEQAESRDTAYISGETALIDAVENSPDFHSANASAFFGIPFEKLFDIETKTRLDKALIDIAKRVNHGANYNMGAGVLVETMGEEKIVEAQRLLNLPKIWGYKRVAEYLLDKFHATYPRIKGIYYPGVVEEISRTRMLKHHLIGISGEEAVNVLTRYCFGDPIHNKHHLNSYVSHPPQSLNAQVLNKAWLRVFLQIAMNPKYSDHFKLIAQIHDSILFQYRKGHEYLCGMVKDLMEIPVTIKGYDGEIRTFTVPAGIKNGKIGEDGVLIPAKYWSDVE